MGRKSPKAEAEKSVGVRVSGWFAAVCMVAFTLWQGSYFQLQFLLIIALLLLAFILCGRSLNVTREAAMLFGIALLYFASLLVLSENRYAGLTEALRALIPPLVFVFFLNSDPARMEKAIFAALICVAALGLLAYASIIDIPGGVIESSGRLQSVLQYANSTALLMLVGALYSIRDFINGKKTAGLCCCAIFICALMFTGSRTTFVVALASLSLYLFIMAGRRGKLIVLGVLLLSAGAIAGLSAFTDIRLFRISIYEPTLVERWITYRDAIAMMRGKWLTGIGAGNWQEWQFRFQSAPYNVKYIHNYYLHLLLDGGILAPVMFCAAMIPAIVRGIRAKSVHAVILIAVMLHSILDFDLVFAAVSMIAMFSLSQLTAGGKTVHAGRLRFAAAAPLIAVMVLWGSEIYSAASVAHLGKGDPEASMKAGKTALALNPLNTKLYYQIAQSTGDAAEAEGYLRIAAEKNPRDLPSISMLALVEAQNGNDLAALELCGILIENRRFSEDYRAQYIETARRAADAGAIGSSEYEGILTEIESIMKGVNPLYASYINTDY